MEDHIQILNSISESTLCGQTTNVLSTNRYQHLQCKDQDVVPNFIKIRHHSKTRAQRVFHCMEKALIRERCHTYQELVQVSRKLYSLHLELSKLLPTDFWQPVERNHREKKKFKKLNTKKSKPEDTINIKKIVVNLSGHLLTDDQTAVLSNGLNLLALRQKYLRRRLKKYDTKLADCYANQKLHPEQQNLLDILKNNVVVIKAYKRTQLSN